MLKASQKALDIATERTDSTAVTSRLADSNAELPDDVPDRPAHASTVARTSSSSTLMEKWKIMGSHRYVEVFGVNAFRRLGV